MRIYIRTDGTVQQNMDWAFRGAGRASAVSNAEVRDLADRAYAGIHTVVSDEPVRPPESERPDAET
jgi:hypothetical protein